MRSLRRWPPSCCRWPSDCGGRPVTSAIPARARVQLPLRQPDDLRVHDVVDRVQRGQQGSSACRSGVGGRTVLQGRLERGADRRFVTRRPVWASDGWGRGRAPGPPPRAGCRLSPGVRRVGRGCPCPVRSRRPGACLPSLLVTLVRASSRTSSPVGPASRTTRRPRATTCSSAPATSTRPISASSPAGPHRAQCPPGARGSQLSGVVIGEKQQQVFRDQHASIVGELAVHG